MNKTFGISKTPFLALFFMTIVISASAYLLNTFTTPSVIDIKFYEPVVLCFFLVSSNIIISRINILKQEQEASAGKALLFITIRFLTALCYLSFITFRDQNNSLLLSLNFLIIYLFYTGFDIIYQLSNLRRNSKTA